MVSALLVALARPRPVVAGSADAPKWCVELGGPGDGFGCDLGQPCNNAMPFATVAEAIEAARTVPDVVPGVRPDTQFICVEGPGVAYEDVEVDNTDGAFGDWLEIRFPQREEGTLCGDPTTWDSQPMIRYTADSDPEEESSLVIRNLVWRDDECGQRSAPLASAAGGRLVLQQARIRGPESAGAVLSAPVNRVEFHVWDSRIEDLGGPLASGPASVTIRESEIGASDLDGVPLIDVSGNFVLVDRSAVYGNVTRGAPLLRGLRFDVRNSYLVENIVVGGEPLIAAAARVEERLLRSRTTQREARLLREGTRRRTGAEGAP
jgi:hypothetical protein